jgi:hypothetical protein
MGVSADDMVASVGEGGAMYPFRLKEPTNLTATKESADVVRGTRSVASRFSR